MPEDPASSEAASGSPESAPSPTAPVEPAPAPGGAVPPAPVPPDHGADHAPHGRLPTLVLAALGVVYGDIGTSPLYALRECFSDHYGLDPTRGNVLGILSLVFWSLALVISTKYLAYVMRADNRGEGGVLALMTIAHPRPKMAGDPRAWLVLMGLFGAALLYGDGMITPAISVLSAVEGLEIATPLFSPYVVPITCVLLCGLFIPQKYGTGRLGAVFGPLILTYFVVIGALGVHGIARDPSVLASIDPTHAIEFFARERWTAFLTLGSVFLVVTGGEALYADMGHFGRPPIRLGWFLVVLPGLLLNYMGQGAILLHDSAAVENPFYMLAPRWALIPLVVLATATTIVASQAVISGSFSLTRQAVQLGYLPRLEINHTSRDAIGQIYVPWVNWTLLAAAIWLVLYFRTSSSLAAAYGIAVTTTMGITTLLIYFVARERWGWPRGPLVAMTAFLLVLDLSFFGANIVKVAHGGWFPLLVGAAILALMTTWRRGRHILGERLRQRLVPLDEFFAGLLDDPPARVRGTAIFMTGNPDGAPQALVHNVRHNRVLHERVILLAVATEEIPYVPESERVSVEPLLHGLLRVKVAYGFMDDPDVPAAMRQVRLPGGGSLDPERTTYFLGRETLTPTRRPGMALWREKLFAFMSRNAQQATVFFRIPADQVVEIGMHIEL